MKPSVLVAVGCSWVAGRAIDIDPADTTFDLSHIEDPAVVAQYSFSGLLQKKLGFDQLYFIAANASNNETQVRKLINFIENNKDNYSQIFVLWGITSVYRWEMYSDSSKDIESCVFGRRYSEGLNEEVDFYFKHLWNKEYKLEQLGNHVVMLDAYLTQHGIEHLFFNSFDSYTDQDLMINSIDDNMFYRVRESKNDMLSFLCVKHNVKLTTTSVPWLNLVRPTVKQIYPNRAIKELQNKGVLDNATAHPTISAHSDIAEELYNYIRG